VKIIMAFSLDYMELTHNLKNQLLWKICSQLALTIWNLLSLVSACSLFLNLTCLNLSSIGGPDEWAQLDPISASSYSKNITKNHVIILKRHCIRILPLDNLTLAVRLQFFDMRESFSNRRKTFGHFERELIMKQIPGIFSKINWF
jgi:hypothetical protein